MLDNDETSKYITNNKVTRILITLKKNTIRMDLLYISTYSEEYIVGHATLKHL